MNLRLRDMALLTPRWTPLLVSALVLAGCRPLAPEVPPPRLLIPNVGQGHGIVLIHGAVLVVDAGPPGSSEPHETLRNLPDHLPVAVKASHGDLDHVGGLAELLQQVRVDELWLGPRDSSDTLEVLCNRARRGCRFFSKGDVLVWGGMEIEILTPQRGANDLQGNAASVVAAVRWRGGVRGRPGDPANLLLTGDIDSTTGARLAAAYPVKLRAQVLQVPHHGSRQGLGIALLGAVDPAVTFVQAGSPNPWGHPHPEILELLTARRVPLWDPSVVGGTVEVVWGAAGPRARVLPQGP